LLKSSLYKVLHVTSVLPVQLLFCRNQGFLALIHCYKMTVYIVTVVSEKQQHYVHV